MTDTPAQRRPSYYSSKPFPVPKDRRMMPLKPMRAIAAGALLAFVPEALN